MIYERSSPDVAPSLLPRITLAATPLIVPAATPPSSVAPTLLVMA
jgi:hypothetical protein